MKSKIEKDGGLSDYAIPECRLNSLSVQALTVVEPFQAIESNYQKALDSLIERYDIKSLIFIDHINALFSMTKSKVVSIRSIIDQILGLRSPLL